MDPFQEAAGIIDDARSSDRIAVVTLTDLRTDGPWARPLDEAEVKRLADWALHLPAVIVAADMRVVDGHRRLAALRRAGLTHAEVLILSDGLTDQRLLEVCALLNTSHGHLPSRGERIDLARQLIAAGSDASDRMLARQLRLGRGTVATLRTHSAPSAPDSCPTGPRDQLDSGSRPDARRRGRDGRSRPVDRQSMRARIASAIAQEPGASARQIARGLGCSPSTVAAVRRDTDRDADRSRVHSRHGLWTRITLAAKVLAQVGRRLAAAFGYGGRT